MHAAVCTSFFRSASYPRGVKNYGNYGLLHGGGGCMYVSMHKATVGSGGACFPGNMQMGANRGLEQIPPPPK